jgi:hypothetical protein
MCRKSSSALVKPKESPTIRRHAAHWNTMLPEAAAAEAAAAAAGNGGGGGGCIIFLVPV